MITLQTRFPTDETGQVQMVAASSAVAPFVYQNGFKIDALGRLVIAG